MSSRRRLIAAGLSLLCGASLCAQETAQVVEDFEGDGGSGWSRAEGALAGKGAGATKDVFSKWSGFALPVKGVPPEADGISFWVRTTDGKSAALKLAMFEAKDGKQTEAWGRGFWATPSWQKYTFPFDKLRRVWAAAGDDKLQSAMVHSVNFQRWLPENSGLLSKEILFDDIVFLKGTKGFCMEKLPAATSIEVDASKPAGRLNRFWRALCVDDSIWGNPYLEPPSGDHIRTIGKDKVFDYVRVGLLMKKARPWISYKFGPILYHEDESGKPVYDFSGQDALMDSLVKDCGLRPMLLFYTVPKELASDPKSGHGNDYPCPPSSYEKWKSFVKACVQHFVDRYGKEAVSQWYWEVWNEPDLWWEAWTFKGKSAGYDEYMKLFDYTAAAIAEVLGDKAKIGGPAIAGFPRDYCERLMKHRAQEKNFADGGVGGPICFLSHHSYSGCLDQMLKLYEEKAAIAQHAKGKDVEVVISEYGNGIWGYQLGTRCQAAALCSAIDGFAYASRTDGARLDWLYWFGVSRVFGSGADSFFRPDFQAMQAKQQVTTLFLHTNGVSLAKPVYNAYRMLNFVDSDWLEVSGANVGEKIRAFATASDDKRRVSVLVYSHDPFKMDTDGKPEEVSLTVKGLPFSGQVEVANYLIDSKHSDVFAAWEAEGAPKSKEITEEQIKRIKAHDSLELEKPTTVKMEKGGTWSIKLSLEPHAVSLFVLTAK